MNIKKKLMVLFAAGIMIISAAPLAFAATPSPSETAQPAVTVPPVTNNVQTQTVKMEENTSHLTKGGAAFWFIFTIVLNTAVSFWIGNRFYRLAKKENHVSGEIRALRKDIEEKFVKSVGGFSETEVDITNLNESLAMNEEGIKPVEKKPVFREVSAEEEERFRRWEEAQSKPRSERLKPRSSVKEEFDEELEDVRKIRRKNYQPKRDRNADAFDNEVEDEIEETKATKTKGESVRSKAKEILGDIFPFKED